MVKLDDKYEEEFHNILQSIWDGELDEVKKYFNNNKEKLNKKSRYCYLDWKKRRCKTKSYKAYGEFYGFTPVETAISSEENEILEYLISMGAKNSKITYKVQFKDAIENIENGDINEVRKYFDRYKKYSNKINLYYTTEYSKDRSTIEISYDESYGFSPLCVAVYSKQYEIIEYLIDIGAKPLKLIGGEYKKYSYKRGNFYDDQRAYKISPLYIALINEDPKAVKILVKQIGEDFIYSRCAIFSTKCKSIFSRKIDINPIQLINYISKTYKRDSLIDIKSISQSFSKNHEIKKEFFSNVINLIHNPDIKLIKKSIEYVREITKILFMICKNQNPFKKYIITENILNNIMLDLKPEELPKSYAEIIIKERKSFKSKIIESKKDRSR